MADGSIPPAAMTDDPSQLGFTISSPPEWEAELTRLAALDPIEYDQQRSAVADKLGCRLPTLDDQVTRRRATPETTAGRGVSLAEVEPWPLPVSANLLLDDLVAAIRRHVVLDLAAAEVVALWIVHTWVAERFQHTPRLCITSPAKRCGKSTLLDVLRVTCRRPLKADNISAAGVYRTIEALAPLTLLLDEADSFLGKNEELRGVLNSGFERSGEVIRVVEVQGELQPVQFHTFAPVALAGIGSLPSTLEDRAVPVVLRRKGAGETATKLRVAGARDALGDLARKLRRWSLDRGPKLSHDPSIPDELGDRAGDVSVPLLAIADDAGDAWSARGRAALLAVFSKREAEGNTTDDDALLLADLCQLFRERGVAYLTSVSIVATLGVMEDRPWPEWRQGKPITPTQLAKALVPFGVRPKNVRDGNSVVKGYTADSFTDVWDRYLKDGH